MKKLISYALLTAMTFTQATTIFAQDAKEYLQQNINNANQNLNSNNPITLVKEITKISRAVQIFENEQNGYILQEIKIVEGLKDVYIKDELIDTSKIKAIAVYHKDTNQRILDIKEEPISITQDDIKLDTSVVGTQKLEIKIHTASIEKEIEIKENQSLEQNISIEKVQYSFKDSFMGEVKVILNKATTSMLTLDNFSIHCPGLSTMTISNIKTSDNKEYILETPTYNDNKYILEIYLNKGTSNEVTLEQNFVVKYTDCPVISYPYTTRIGETSAKFNFVSDLPGDLYYLIVEDTTNLRTIYPTIEQVKAGTKIAINALPSEININGLVANKKYSLFYATAKGTDISEVYGPVKISDVPIVNSTSDISIENMEVLETATTQSVKITLNKPTQTKLEMNAFTIKCPAGSNLKFDTLTTTDNKAYTLTMYGGFLDNNYEVKVTFPDGTFTTGNFRSELKTPTITAVKPIRTSETTATITFNSDRAGTIYYGVSKEPYVTPTVAEIIANGQKQAIHQNSNTIKLEGITMEDKHFYWLAESSNGSKPYFVDGAGKYDFSGRIPDTIVEEKPPVETQIKIESVIEEKEYKRIKVILSEKATGLMNYEMSINGNNNSYSSKKYLQVDYGWSDEPDYLKVFYISPFVMPSAPFPADTYTLTIKFPDGDVTKEFTIN